MSSIIRFVLRRFLRLLVSAAIVPLAGIAAVKVADRMEQGSGPSTITRLLRQTGGRVSYRGR